MEKAQQKVEEISKLGQQLGIDFKYSDSKYSNTFDAHRLMKLAENKYDHKTVARLNENLFEAYFVKGLILADLQVLYNVGLESGLKSEDIRQTLWSDQYAADVRKDEHEASLFGARGVPFMIFNDEFAIPGALPTEGFVAALERAERHTDKVSAETAHVCGPNGCEV